MHIIPASLINPQRCDVGTGVKHWVGKSNSTQVRDNAGMSDRFRAITDASYTTASEGSEVKGTLGKRSKGVAQVIDGAGF